MMTSNNAEVLAALVAERRAADRAAREAARAKTPAAIALKRAEAAAEADPSDGSLRVAARAAEAALRSALLDEHVERLRTLIVEMTPIVFDYEAVKTHAAFPVFDVGELGTEEEPPAPPSASVAGGLLGRVLPSARTRHEAAVSAAAERHKQALAEHAEREEHRHRMLAEAMAAHERAVAEAEAAASGRNRGFDAFRAAVEAGDPAALCAHFAAVLAASDYPDGFPRRATVALDPEGRLLVADEEFPGLDIVPEAQEYRYNAGTDTFEEVPRPASRRKDLYALVVASAALRSVRELLDADRARVIDEVAFNGYVHGVDRATGEAVRPYLVSLRANREEFRLLDIQRTDPVVSMNTVEASFSASPADLAPAKEVVGVKAVGAKYMASSPEV